MAFPDRADQVAVPAGIHAEPRGAKHVGASAFDAGGKSQTGFYNDRASSGSERFKIGALHPMPNP
ncbi:hypothetical protein PEL8287_01050 [Roseovarius litorisediminis]|uniref:Uncharacterized protein n=1 Tax=Roseovarius litorisediminis TaxID=1312363 RepID=A0A1Y5RSM8_9RHOB|nr:hypothetical protein PEL8287_01050 [Roseovarius litorisediminis]